MLAKHKGFFDKKDILSPRSQKRNLNLNSEPVKQMEDNWSDDDSNASLSKKPIIDYNSNRVNQPQKQEEIKKSAYGVDWDDEIVNNTNTNQKGRNENASWTSGNNNEPRGRFSYNSKPEQSQNSFSRQSNWNSGANATSNDTRKSWSNNNNNNEGGKPWSGNDHKEKWGDQSQTNIGNRFGFGYNPNGNANNYNSKKDDEPAETKPKTGAIDWDFVRKQPDQNMEKFKNQPDIVKNFYTEPPNLMNYQEAVEFRKKNFNIKIELFKKENLKFCTSVSNAEPEKDKTPEETEEYLSKNVPSPFRTFQEGFSRYPDLLEELRLQKFEKPTPIQSQMWPILLKGLDCVGIAQTGTGKTLAFLLPALIHIDGQTTPRSERGGPNVLVLSPTRELALQIEQEVKKINYKGIKSVCIYGGGDRKEQINVCTRGVEIIIGTPGRLYDLMKAGAINVTSVTYLVMDEADRMLDLGFEPQILKILLDIRPDRQTVMTSATWPSGVRRLATKYLKEPIQLYVDTLDLRAAKTVEQHIVILRAEDDKTTMLMDYIENKMEPEDKLIVFVSRKSTADTLSCDLILKSISCQSIHGDREQCDREQALEDFKESYVRILIATDVASRGIDVKDITCVFNYDFPHNMEEYVHRVGRTGRAGRTGKSITLMTRQDWKNAKELIEILQEGGQEILPELVDMAERYEAMKRRKMEEEGSFGGRGGRGGGSGCFNCGQEGHMSRECPSGGRGGGRGRGSGRGGGNRW